MIPYLIMIALPGIFALGGLRRATLVFIIVALLYWAMIGFRLHVGMDWNNYLILYQYHHRFGLRVLFQYYEPAYAFLDWFAGEIGGGYILVNVVCATVFCWGFFSVARQCEEPFLAIVTATPLLVVAFAMSGARQSIAMGIIFYLFATWERRTTLIKIGLVLLAAAFHSSAIFMMIFVALGSNLPHAIRIGLVVPMIAMVFAFIRYRPGAFEAYNVRYVAAGALRQTAPGAVAEVGVLALAGIVYLVMRKRFREIDRSSTLHEYLAAASLAAIPAMAVSSVGAYRLALYFSPMAMHVWSGLPVFFQDARTRTLYRIIVVGASIAMLVGWLTLANNSYAWLPYENWLFHPAGSLYRMFLHGSRN